ncbi:MAG: hypothetical protein FWH27_05960 [Planctomycetaceae bacterium]|nr:hypothetical protein [Planctomycetaceae bacterium]
MRIVITQTTIVIDFPEETAQPARKPVHPLTLLEKVLRAAEAERESTPKTPTFQERFHGTFLTQ